MKVSFSLASSKAKVAAKPVGETPSLKRSAAFASLDDDEPVDAAPTASDNRKVAANKKLVAQNVELSKTMKKRMEEEMKVDSSVFQYDEVWEKMQQAKQKQKEAKEADAKERKPKYIDNLLQSAATRRIDHLRAEQKMIQRERESEGDEFKDKEAFVTQSYKDQLAETQRAEEEERQREEAEKKKNKGAGSGMAHFYRKLLDESEQQHEEAVAAAATTTKPAIGPQGPNLTITKPVDFVPKSDVDLAKAAKEQGKDVELNDDNQIVDKRELLSAGLNLSAPNTRKFGLQTIKKNEGEEQPQVHRAVGTAASRKEINERRAREVAKQMEEERERLLKEKEKEEQESINRMAAKRNDEESVKSARERYLERKRRRLEKGVADPDGET
ncbi:coiled-coil domain-containing protein 55-domain containing protein [Rhodofomes roseus]|uniref:Coiled-coil domain-containing protein 55-domain containing protein n=1 Tax=Rhodofomes roseus TaxID=34475 RepID=A0A4Y9YSG1_9APHY|nr:coiled-coil domain-containing protein 55-domain containing protein [Rhodofomes roseus]KAH9842616.1 coiled-coil domain-containing protein 55-domain containing protein [Rhodofomes roseus]TFY64029.1 hypothetical protein EVJ58_g2895 [Rhodofomes roseus]